MSEAKVGLDSKVRRKTGLENDNDATPTGGAWEGLDGVANGSRVSNLCLIPMMTKDWVHGVAILLSAKSCCKLS